MLSPNVASGLQDVSSPAMMEVSPAAGEGRRNYSVIPGDTVYGVAARFDVPIRTLIEVNGLSAPFQLQPGQELVIPVRQEHVVQPGQTVQSIARIHGVDQSSLIRLNRIPPPYVVHAGQRLRLPAPVETATAPAAPVTVDPAPATAPAGGMTVEELPPPTVAAPGPGAAPVDRAAAPPASGGTANPLPVPQTGPVPLPLPPAEMGSAEAAPGDGTPQPTTREPDRGLAPAAGPAASVMPSGPAEPVPAAIPQPPPLSSGKFLWPVNGQIISGFGAKDGGLHNDGINIAAPRGSPVRAAESGVVAYAGNELRGFGNLLLIRHADGWMSAYAHNDTLLVQRGDQVKRGQTIARVGSTGNVSTPQLHFELRRGTRSVDPLKHLRTQDAAS